MREQYGRKLDLTINQLAETNLIVSYYLSGDEVIGQEHILKIHSSRRKVVKLSRKKTMLFLISSMKSSNFGRMNSSSNICQ